MLISRLRLALSAGRSSCRRPHAGRRPDDERSYWIARLAGEIDVLDRNRRPVSALDGDADAAARFFPARAREEAVRLRRSALLAAPSLRTLARRRAPRPSKRFSRGAACRSSARKSPRGWINWPRSTSRRRANAASETVARLRDLSRSAARARPPGSTCGSSTTPAGSSSESATRWAVRVEFSSHYDLLASECRLASLVAIAKGDVPVEHWFALGPPAGVHVHGQTLLSWSGTMFEFLMPLLFTRTFTNSLLDHACREAVKLQIDYGREKNVPWGISESAYSALDANQIYQYRAFGVPSLALNSALKTTWWWRPMPPCWPCMIDPRGCNRKSPATWNPGDGRAHGDLRIDRFHPREQARRRSGRGDLRLHGTSPGHELAGSR